MTTKTKPKPKAKGFNKLMAKLKRSAIPEAHVLQPGDVTCPNGHDLAESLAAQRSATAIAVRPPAVIDVTSQAAGGSLDARERKALARCEAEIERGGKKALEGFVSTGRALREIRDSRLYRLTHRTFEAYLADRHGLKKTSGYELIDGASAYELASPIAETLKLRFTAPAQLRPLTKIDSRNGMKDVLQPYARTLKADSRGEKLPTMDGLEQAVRNYTAAEDHTPEDIKRHRAEERAIKAEANAARLRAAAESHGLPELTADPPSGAPATDREAEWHGAVAVPPPKEIDPGIWNGRPTGWAEVLHRVRATIEDLAANHPVAGGAFAKDFREDLASLLSSLALELQGLDHDSWHAASQEQRDAIAARSKAKSGRRAK